MVRLQEFTYACQLFPNDYEFIAQMHKNFNGQVVVSNIHNPIDVIVFLTVGTGFMFFYFYNGSQSILILGTAVCHTILLGKLLDYLAWHWAATFSQVLAFEMLNQVIMKMLDFSESQRYSMPDEN
jgi:hypothetical protein